MKQLILAAALTLTATFALASYDDEPQLGQRCSIESNQTFWNCLKNESEKIWEANLPNEIIYSAKQDARESLLALVGHKPALVQQVKEAAAFVLIVQYQDEARLFYYTVSAQGELKPVFEYNIVDFQYDYKGVDKSVLHLKVKHISDTFKEWLEEINNDEE
jgi:hypothetical protein